MVKELELSTNEKELIISGLKEGIRLDGRGIDDFRSLKITLGPEYGRSEVKLGDTKVLAKVSCEVARPYPDRPNEGILTLNTELSPMAFAGLEPGRPSEEEVLVSRILEKAIKINRAVDVEGLCIVANELAWSIHVDVHFLDNDGNIIDAACIAAISALSHFRRPDVTVIGEDVTIHPVDQRNPVPLSIHHTPICVTFAFFENGDLWVVDPSLKEEQIRRGDMIIAINNHKEICVLSKAGGLPLEMHTIIQCSKLAASKVDWVREKIQDAIANAAEVEKRKTLREIIIDD
ncbi:ribosomal protein S5 domain 2-type protein [Gigaspora margarita]|uniref:Exosome complex component RRP45 n=1 Tax=Gigaspora margarita TaxID=4874 RepID=A0A8H3WX38_GIGMA|nr:ribosomal protein S5 domain 2-type protein [Gigaspora margarita]